MKMAQALNLNLRPFAPLEMARDIMYPACLYVTACMGATEEAMCQCSKHGSQRVEYGSCPVPE